MVSIFSIITLYFILYIYGEFSKYPDIRYISRIILYGLSANLIFTHYIPEVLYSTVLSGTTLIFTFIYLMITTDNKLLSKLMFIPFMIVIINYSVVIWQPPELIYWIPAWYFENSDEIFRKWLILSLGSLSLLYGKGDDKLNFATLILFATEHTIITSMEV